MNEELVRTMIYTEQIRNLLFVVIAILIVIWVATLFKK